MSVEACPYEVRWARLSEWEETMAFVWNVFLTAEGKSCSEKGRKQFLDFISDPSLKTAFEKGEYPVLLALEKERIAGMAAVRDHSHLSLLFVDEKHRMKGIGRMLTECMMQYARSRGERFMSLYAASEAVDFYRKLKFRAIRPEEEFSGIRITYMETFF